MTVVTFKQIYSKLFNAQTEAIKILQEAQQEVESMYADLKDPDDTEKVPLREL